MYKPSTNSRQASLFWDLEILLSFFWATSCKKEAVGEKSPAVDKSSHGGGFFSTASIFQRAVGRRKAGGANSHAMLSARGRTAARVNRMWGWTKK